MSATPWKQIRTALRAETPPPPVAPAAFWATFKARAALVNQDPVVPPAKAAWWTWLVAPATLALVALALCVDLTAPAARPRMGNIITALDVQGTHSGVLVIQDPESQGTIVWITDMAAPASGEGTR